MVRKIDEAYRKVGKEFAIRIWDRPERIDEIIQEAIDEQYDVVVAAGGDGTINEICQRLVGTGIALGVIPIGSGNGFARHLGYSRKPRRAIGQLLAATPVEVDTGDFGGITFINNAGIGIDAEVAEHFSQSTTRGLKTYLRLASRAFFQYETFECTLVVDGQREYNCKELLLMDIANGTQWGSGAKIALLSNISDGYLEAIIMEKVPLREIPRLIKLLFTGKIYRHPKIKIVRGKRFEIRRPMDGNAHVDGESVQLGSTIQAQIREKSVRLLVPETKQAV